MIDIQTMNIELSKNGERKKENGFVDLRRAKNHRFNNKSVRMKMNWAIP